MSSAFVNADEARRLEALAGLSDCNQFLPERIAFEERALGPDFEKTTEVWHAEADLRGLNPNLPRLAAAAEALAATLRDRLRGGARPTREELLWYEGMVRYLLFYRYEGDFYALIEEGEAGGRTTRKIPAYKRHARDVAHFLDLPGIEFPFPVDAAHLFAWGFQIRRAWRHTFRQIYGGSMAAARLRAAVWQSIFTHDAQRYRRSLYARMGDIPTLIVGESGTGKELVARAIGLSRYIPFDAQGQCFGADYVGLFAPVNLSALSTGVIESELFGHRKGAFTGAVTDHAGWFETCPALGSVFLDEIGELSPEVQVKLLRVLQSRTFQRVGETEARRYEGKIIAATNRDLAQDLDRGDFRRDFYYRISGDVVHTPTLRAQLEAGPGELRNMAMILARRIVGEEEADALADDVIRFAERALGPHYAWPGNIRELEQCVRSVMIRGTYRPLGSASPGSDNLARAIDAGELSADELLRRYCTVVYAKTGTYEETARRLGLDRRTVKARLDRELLEKLTGPTTRD